MNPLVLLLTSLVLSAAASATANSLQREDFAFGMDILLEHEGALYSFVVPEAVYRACTRSDLGDLRIFNAQGTVPHLLRQHPATELKQSRHPLALPFFPLSNSQPEPAEFRIASDNQGTIISLRSGPRVGQSISAYILDASALPAAPAWLDLTWTGPNFSATVQVDSSNDLSDWQPLLRGVHLADLRFGGHQLLHNRLKLDQQRLGKYLRLAWPPGEQGVQLTGVQVGFAPTAAAPQRKHLHLHGSPDDTRKYTWLYHSQGFFPVDQVHVRLSEENTVAKIELFSKAEAEGSWTQRASLLAWNLRVEGHTLHNPSQNIRLTTDPWWRIEMEASGTAPLAAPLLDLAWLPAQLLFLGQGEAPYTLAYGRAGLQAQASQVEQVLHVLNPVLSPAVLGPERIVGGKERLIPVRSRNWQGWLLWVALLMGLAMVTGMALRLWKEMGQGKPKV